MNLAVSLVENSSGPKHPVPLPNQQLFWQNGLRSKSASLCLKSSFSSLFWNAFWKNLSFMNWMELSSWHILMSSNDRAFMSSCSSNTNICWIDLDCFLVLFVWGMSNINTNALYLTSNLFEAYVLEVYADQFISYSLYLRAYHFHLEFNQLYYWWLVNTLI